LMANFNYLMTIWLRFRPPPMRKFSFPKHILNKETIIVHRYFFPIGKLNSFWKLNLGIHFTKGLYLALNFFFTLFFVGFPYPWDFRERKMGWEKKLIERKIDDECMKNEEDECMKKRMSFSKKFWIFYFFWFLIFFKFI